LSAVNRGLAALGSTTTATGLDIEGVDATGPDGRLRLELDLASATSEHIIKSIIYATTRS
jgi:hypothetical protein